MASANQSNLEPISTSVQGRVKWFNVKAGYGFIKRNDTNEDIFVHRASILRPNPEHAIPSLDDSEEVIFDIIQSTKGLEAVNVTGPSRGTVVGNSRAIRRHRRGGAGRGYSSGYGRGRGRDMYSGSDNNWNFSQGQGMYFRGSGPRGGRGGYFGGGGGRGGYYGNTGAPRGRGGRGGAPGRMGNNNFSGGRFDSNSNGNY